MGKAGFEIRLRMPKNKFLRLLLKISGAVLLFTAVLLLVGYIYEPYARKADAEAYPPPGKMVDIGGYNLHINCKGSGNPPVIIDAGWGAWSSAWRAVQDKIAEKTQVCTYDRAGMGWSDKGSLPRDAKQFSEELHILLQNSGIQGPYVLAGHSSGGFTVRVYTGEYPSEVSGVVLIDSMSPKQYKAEALNTGRSASGQDSQVIPFLARFGITRATSAFLNLIAPDPSADKSATAQQSDPKFLQTFLDEGQGLPGGAFQASRVESFGDIPLIVLSAGKKNTSFKDWDEMQKELIQLSSNSRQLIAQNSGHDIEIDQPEAAADAVNMMVDQIRLTESSKSGGLKEGIGSEEN